MNGQIAALDRRIAELTPKHPEAYLFAGLPGAGPALLPRLSVAFGTERDRFQSAAELAAYSGIAPVSRQSGQSKAVVFRRACPPFYGRPFRSSPPARDANPLGRAPSTSSKETKARATIPAVRALAFKWIRILFRCWKDRTPYDEARYVRCLQQRLEFLHIFRRQQR